MAASWIEASGLVMTATLIAMAGLLLISALQRRATAPKTLFNASCGDTVFIFDGEDLLDATPPARALIAGEAGPGDAWFRVIARLEPLFPGLMTRLEGLQREGRFVLCSREDLTPALVLRAEHQGGLTRLALIDSADETSFGGSDAQAEAALRDELSLLRDTLTRAPLPVWRETAEGGVIWANGPYLALVAEQIEAGRGLSWPLPALFPPPHSRARAQETRPPEPRPPETRAKAGSRSRANPAAERYMVKSGHQQLWFRIISQPAHPGPSAGRLCYALPADAEVAAEQNLSEFIQTLAKTFAQLPIGLAIFDQDRVLQMFNPALMDLTGLPVDLLIARPTLPVLLDTMRENAKLPEPKDYRSWRRQMAEMEQAASQGLFSDTWILPDGQTWRVSGRPHPNGALAFMIEDISSEMSRSRRYRADLELGQAVIDGLSDAVVVFAQDGTLAMANAAAAALWGDDLPRHPPGQGGNLRPVPQWRLRTAPTLLWNDLEEFIGQFGPREAWDGELRMEDGRPLSCSVVPMPHGATLVTFRLTAGGRMRDQVADPSEDQAVLIA